MSSRTDTSLISRILYGSLHTARGKRSGHKCYLEQLCQNTDPTTLAIDNTLVSLAAYSGVAFSLVCPRVLLEFDVCVLVKP